MDLFKLKEGQSYLEVISFAILLVLTFLLPIFISPSALLSFIFAKTFLVVSLTATSFMLLVLYILKNGSVRLPKSWWFFTLLLVPIVTLVSALLSLSRSTSLIGYGVEMDTFFLVLVAFVLMFLSSQVFVSAKRIFYAQVAFIGSIFLLFIFHGLRLVFGPGILSFGSFPAITSNTFGAWSDLAVFAGLIVIFSTLLLELTKATKQVRIVGLVLFSLATIFLVIVNSVIVWLILGVLSLVSFVYLFSFGSKDRKIPFLSLIILVLSVLFLIAGDQIGGALNSFFGINISDARPSWSGTVEIIRHSFSGVKNILVGTGPNTFSLQWSLYKPLGVNETALWNTSFDYGVSYLATTLITTGVLGAISWILFLVFFVYQGFKSIIQKGTGFLKYISISSFISALFLWLVLLFSVPGIVVFFLTFIFSGIFLASLSLSGLLENKEFSFTNNPKIGFVITLALVFLLIVAVDFGYISTQKTLSSVYYQKSLNLLNSGDIDGSQRNISRAISFAEHDMYYRLLSNIEFARFTNILNTEDTNSNAVIGRADQSLGRSISAMQSAIESRPLNYQNYLALGDIYTEVSRIGVPGSLEGARATYQVAKEYAPNNPIIPLKLARLEASQGDIVRVRQNIDEALRLKSNYTEAVFTLAQIEVAAGNIDQAIASVEVATVIEPNNPVLHFQLGILYYNNNNYQDAVASFEDAIDIVSDYANARYFLGLSYYELGNRSDAVSQFEKIRETNPGNEEVEFILENLNSGNSPFAEVQDPLDDEPENREELPIDEE